ncbi:Nitroreductase-like protein [Aspergillus filifer]
MTALRTTSRLLFSRPSLYLSGLGNKSPAPDSKIEELVNAAILHVPSSFNTQSTRLIVLLHDSMRSCAIPKGTWEKQTLLKIQGLKAGVGTVLFYENPAHIKPLSEKFALYKDKFEAWAEHSNAMHQYFCDLARTYNPLIDAPVAKQWGISPEWRLIAQLVFGSPEGAPGEKTFKPIEERVKIYGGGR